MQPHPEEPPSGGVSKGEAGSRSLYSDASSAFISFSISSGAV
jgi:hypothetical protein